jgi:membrane-associated phospholipid phosphatase
MGISLRSEVHMRRTAGTVSIRVVLFASLLVVAGALPAAAQVSPTATPPAAPPSLAAVFGQVPKDLWHFLNWDTAKILAIGGGAAAVGHIWDDDLSGELETSVRLNDAFSPGHTYGAFTVQVLIGAGLYTGGRIAKHGHLAQTGGDIMRAQLLSQIYVQGIKYTAQRERPDGSNSQSFPSGHSASAFATASVLQRQYGWKVGVPAMVLAGYVATARVHDNKHYLSDVIFGASMGIAAEHTVSLHSGRYTWDVVPTGGPDRVGVMVSLRPR